MISPGRILILVGLIILILGFFISGREFGISWLDAAVHKFLSLFRWIGNLPGDLKFEWRGSTLYAPVTSGIVASIVLTIIFWFLRRLF